MSWLPVSWAESAPVADVYERAIITLLAHRARADGTGAYPSTPSMARFAVCDERSIRRRLESLQARGVIALGDQDLAAKIPVSHRPRVYDLLIPYEWYSSAQMEEVDRERIERGDAVLRPEDRPAMVMPAKGRKERSDAGAPRPRKAPAKQGDVSNQDASSDPDRQGGLVVQPEGQGGLVVQGRGDYKTPNTVRTPNMAGDQAFRKNPPAESSFGRDQRSTNERALETEQLLLGEDLDSEPPSDDHEVDARSVVQDHELHGGDQHLVPVPEPVEFTGRTVVAAWVDAYRAAFDEEPTGSQKGQVGQHANQLIKAGRRQDRILYAARSAATLGFPNVTEEYRRLLMRAQGRSANNDSGIKPSTTDQRVNQALALAAKYEALEAGLQPNQHDTIHASADRI